MTLRKLHRIALGLPLGSGQLLRAAAGAIFALLSWVSPVSAAPQYGFDLSRLENEARFGVPLAQEGAVWTFLQQTFPKSVTIHGLELKTSTAIEDFMDDYYDTVDAKLTKSWVGMRHRHRTMEDGSVKELIQIKLTDANQADTRGEVKFKVRTDRSKESRYDVHPFFALVERTDRRGIIRQLAKLGIQAHEIRHLLSVRDTRKRVYFTLNGESAFTITLDSYVGEKFFFRAPGCELEFEVNEVLFTRADPAQRELLLAAKEELEGIILQRFPWMKPDLRPKNLKAYEGLIANGPLTAFALHHPDLSICGIVTTFFVLLFGLAIAIGRSVARAQHPDHLLTPRFQRIAGLS